MSEPGACHAVVADVPASWADYALVAAALGDHAPEGLIVHAAGRTDEGFRILEVWESKEAWQRFRDGRLDRVLREEIGDRATLEPMLREFAVERLVQA
jgi:heme-degrading monooxygenase HmoA